MEKVFLLFFYGLNCAPCEAQKPIIKKVAENVKIELIEKFVFDNIDLAQKFNVSSVPTTILLKGDDKVLKEWNGLKKEDELIKEIKELIG